MIEREQWYWMMEVSQLLVRYKLLCVFVYLSLLPSVRSVRGQGRELLL